MTNSAKTLLSWLLLLPIWAVLTGVQQHILTYAPGWMEGLIAVVLTLMAVILLAAYLAWGLAAPQPGRVYWSAGLTWVLLTLAFEIFRVWQHPYVYWSDLLGHYTFRAGDMGALIALTMLGAPRIAGASAGRRAKRRGSSCQGPPDGHAAV